MGLSHSPKVVTDGLILCLDAANPRSYSGIGSSWVNLMDSNVMNLNNSPTYVDSGIKSIEFDGINQGATSIGNLGITGNNPWSISIWMNVNSSESGSGRKGWVLWVGSDSQSSNQLLSISVTTNSIEVAHWNNDVVYTNTPISFNSWANYVVDFDGVTERIYKNSIETDSRTTTLALIDGVLKFGYGYSGLYLNYNLAIAQVYNRTLSSVEIKQNFNALRGRYNI